MHAAPKIPVILQDTVYFRSYNSAFTSQKVNETGDQSEKDGKDES